MGGKHETATDIKIDLVKASQNTTISAENRYSKKGNRIGKKSSARYVAAALITDFFQTAENSE
jgi:hypothetical protein